MTDDEPSKADATIDTNAVTGTDNSTDNSTEASVTIERTFDAPRDRVWAAWTEPDQLAAWYGPPGWSLPVCDVDFEEGGTWHYCMRSPDGQELWVKAVFERIVEPERIVLNDAPSDEHGNTYEDQPEMRLTVEFADHGETTTLTLLHEGFPQREASERAGAAWEGSLGVLEAHVEGDR